MSATSDEPTAGRVTLPTWNTDRFFPGLRSREYAAAREAAGAEIARLGVLYDRHHVRGGPPRPATPADRAALEEILAATNDLLERIQTLDAYIYAFVSTDADDDLAAAEESRLQADLVTLSQLETRFDAWVGHLGAADLLGGEAAEAHAFGLARAEESASHLMSETEEHLLSELRLTGGTAWSRLAGDVTSRLTGSLDGEPVPITVLRGYATDADPARRHAAYRAEVAAWETVAVPVAACLNGIKGEAVTVNARRGWSDALAPALWANAVEPEALAAMQTAAVAAFPDFRRFLRAKARLHAGDGQATAGLAWWDLVAPVPGEASVSWTEATEAVEAAFATFSPQLAGLARRAVAEGWVDAGARRGKRGGAFCMPVQGRESRVLMNFDGSWDSVSTLAHELGHAYHNTNLADRTALQRRTPMALAETASIFCETILVQAGLAGADGEARLALLNLDLTGATQVVVDIHSRFLFESALFERRKDGPVPPTELCALMTDAQRATYGDGLQPPTLHPYMWAVKPHYYGVDAHFYNWPYCFGLLFGIGLYARYVQDPPASDPATTTSWPRPEWGPRPPWRGGSTSTSRPSRFGPPASTSCGPASTTSSPWSTPGIDGSADEGVDVPYRCGHRGDPESRGDPQRAVGQ